MVAVNHITSKNFNSHFSNPLRSPLGPVSMNVDGQPLPLFALNGTGPVANHVQPPFNDSALDSRLQPLECGWRNCQALLRSWGVLETHVHRVHCEQPNILNKTGGTASRGLKTFACHYSTCHIAPFSTSLELKTHVTIEHLDRCKATCSVDGCNRTFPTHAAAVQHTQKIHWQHAPMEGLSTSDQLQSLHLPKPPESPLLRVVPSWHAYTPVAWSGHLRLASSTPAGNMRHLTNSWNTWSEAPEEPLPDKFQANSTLIYNHQEAFSLMVRPQDIDGTELNGGSAQGVRKPQGWDEELAARLTVSRPTLGFEVFKRKFHSLRGEPDPTEEAQHPKHRTQGSC